jgi:hypothetical protein
MTHLSIYAECNLNIDNTLKDMKLQVVKISVFLFAPFTEQVTSGPKHSGLIRPIASSDGTGKKSPENIMEPLR